MLTAAIYARCSTAMQTTDLQLDALRDYCHNHGMEIYAEYVDEGVSGSKRSRPALDRLMADAFKREFDVVVVYKFDRFARSTIHLLEALEKFEDHGVSFVSVSQQLDTRSAMGKLIFAILGAVAEMERELIRERVTAGVRRAIEKRKGKWGREAKPIDLEGYEDYSTREAARKLGVSRETIRKARKRMTSDIPRP